MKQRRTLPLIAASIVMLAASLLPSAAFAYWGCVSVSSAPCEEWTWCREYNDATDRPTGRVRIQVEFNHNC